MSIRWITPMLGTAAATAAQGIPDISIVDVRDLVDKAGNGSGPVQEKIRQGVELLTQGKRTVVCCDYGMSRSNAIATGILATFEKIGFEKALRRVQEATGEAQIKVEPLNAVRDALGLRSSAKPTTSQRTILVTGGSGFLGQALQASVQGDQEVSLVVPSRQQLDLYQGSTQLDLLANEENVQAILHLASPRVYTSNIAMGQTLTMLRNAIDVCLAKDIPLIYLSSWEIYSGYAGTLRANEATPPLPKGPYGETKFLADTLIQHSRKTAGLRCALIRSSPVYGAGSDKPKFIYNFMEKARNSKPIVTHRYRNGDPALDLLCINDLIAALRAVLKTGFVGDLNIGTGTLTSTSAIAQMLIDRIGSNSRVEHLPIEAEVASIAMDWRRAKAELGWQPTVTLAEGLDRLFPATKKP